MRVTKYRPFRSASTIDKMFDNLFSTQLSELVGGEFTQSTPSTNITETEGGYQLALAIPGVSKEDVQIEVDKDTLFVKASRSASGETETYKRREFNFTSFERKFYLGETIDQEDISAKHENGILSIQLKHKKGTEKKTISIK